MAEMTKAEAAAAQYRLGQSYRTLFLQLTLQERTQLEKLFASASQARSERDFMRIVRETFPVIMNDTIMLSITLAAQLYAESREIYATTKGVKIAADHSPRPADFVKADGPNEIIEKRMREVGFFFGQIDRGEKSIAIARSEIIQTAERAPLDAVFNFERFEMLRDDDAKDEPKVVSSGSGCNFCKHMAAFAGVGEGLKFHKNCGCTAQPAWLYEQDFRPEWVDEYEDAFYARKKEIEEYNAGLTEKSRLVTKKRWSESKQKEVTATVRETYYVDKDGKETNPEKTTTAHIIATLPR